MAPHAGTVAKTTSVLLAKLLWTVSCLRHRAPSHCVDPDPFRTIGPTSVDFSNRLALSDAGKLIKRGAFSIPWKFLGLRPTDQSCHHETWLLLDFVDWSKTWRDADEEAGTTASLDHIIARLQILEAADQVHNASEFDCGGQLAQRGCPPSSWRSLQSNGPAGPLRFPPRRSEATCPFRRLNVSHRCIVEFVFTGCPTRGSILSPRCRHCHRCSLHRSSHTLGLEQERRL